MYITCQGNLFVVSFLKLISSWYKLGSKVREKTLHQAICKLSLFVVFFCVLYVCVSLRTVRVGDCKSTSIVYVFLYKRLSQKKAGLDFFKHCNLLSKSSKACISCCMDLHVRVASDIDLLGILRFKFCSFSKRILLTTRKGVE